MRWATVIISQRLRRKIPLLTGLQLYKGRHLVENVFYERKELKRAQANRPAGP